MLRYAIFHFDGDTIKEYRNLQAEPPFIKSVNGKLLARPVVEVHPDVPPTAFEKLGNPVVTIEPLRVVWTFSYVSPTLLDYQRHKINQIKQEFQVHANNTANEVEQRILLADGMLLQHKGQANWTVGETNRWNNFTTIWTRIRSLYVVANQSVAAVNAATTLAEVAAVQPAWPDPL